jgi:hypothetical protein
MKRFRIGILAAMMTLPLVACYGDAATFDEFESADMMSRFSTVVPVAVAEMNVIDLPDSATMTLSFTGPTNIATQAQNFPLLRKRKVRQCVSNALTAMGLEAYLAPTAEPGSLPVFPEPLSLIEINCKGHLMTMSFRSVIGGSNDDGPVYAVTAVIIEVIEKAWDRSCGELTCLQQAVDGTHETCGCLESDLVSCIECPVPQDLPACCE